MPYKRKGKCVYKDTGRKMGCSDSASKAKKYIKALYANAGENEELGSFQNYYNKAEENAEKKKKISKTRAKCQSKAKRKYDVWPSAYASGYVQKCVNRGGNIK